jgi:hypothetical protein
LKAFLLLLCFFNSYSFPAQDSMSATTITEEPTTLTRVETLRTRFSSVQSSEGPATTNLRSLPTSSKVSRSSSQEREVSQLKQENLALKLENNELKKKNSKLSIQNSRLTKENEANNADLMVIDLKTIEECDTERKKFENLINQIDQRKVSLSSDFLIFSLSGFPNRLRLAPTVQEMIFFFASFVLNIQKISCFLLVIIFVFVKNVPKKMKHQPEVRNLRNVLIVTNLLL